MTSAIHILAISFFGISMIGAKNMLHEILLTPDGIVFGMPESDLTTNRNSVFPGPALISKDESNSLKTFMEIEGMGAPGHKSFYYLFENNKLQGVIKTESLMGFDKAQAKSVVIENYKRIYARAFGKADSQSILRKGDVGFAKVTLNKWSGDEEPFLDVFHVATNKESTVGVILRDSNIPIPQLFIPANDERFRGGPVDDSTIVDVPLDELERACDSRQPSREQSKPESDSLKEDNQIQVGVGKNKDAVSAPAGETIRIDSPVYIIVIGIIAIMLTLFVIWKSKKTVSDDNRK